MSSANLIRYVCFHDFSIYTQSYFTEYHYFGWVAFLRINLLALLHSSSFIMSPSECTQMRVWSNHSLSTSVPGKESSVLYNFFLTPSNFTWRFPDSIVLCRVSRLSVSVCLGLIFNLHVFSCLDCCLSTQLKISDENFPPKRIVLTLSFRIFSQTNQ